jgi:hypothetical protein
MGVATPTWSQEQPPEPPAQQPDPFLADPLLEDYSAHVIPFYKINADWSAFLVIADTSRNELDEGGSTVNLFFYNNACDLVADARVEVTRFDAAFFALHDTTDANGQFNGLPGEGVVLVDGLGRRINTYILLVNGNNNSLLRIDSIPCRGPGGGPCIAGQANGTWLRYDIFNTIAATFGDSGDFSTNLHFYSATGDLAAALGTYGTSRHGTYAQRIVLFAYCDEKFLGSKRLNLDCTQRLGLDSFNFTLLNEFPNDECNGKPGHIETVASDNGISPVGKDYSGFQETLASLVPPAMLIGTGYYHHRETVQQQPEQPAP